VLIHVVCAFPLFGHVVVVTEVVEKQCTFGNQVVSSHSGKTKKVRFFFGILSQLKILSKYNEVHAYDITFCSCA
jgi:hypothetical protein